MEQYSTWKDQCSSTHIEDIIAIKLENHQDATSDHLPYVSHSSVVVSKHGLYVGGPGSIPTAVNTMTAAGGAAEHVSLNH